MQQSQKFNPGRSSTHRAVKAEPSDVSVARLRLQAGEVDGPAVHARGRSRLQAVHLKPQAREHLGQPG